jgi:hypothetical protein
VKTENPSACVTVNCKMRRSAIRLHLPVVPSCVNKVPVKSNRPIQKPSINHEQPLHVTIYTYCGALCLCGSNRTSFGG